MADSIISVIINMIKKGTGDKEATAGIKSLGEGFKQLTGFSLGSVTALAAVGMGLREVTQFAKESVNETIAYNKQIREMTQVTGLGAEEISRIVQVGDDWGISIENIRTSLAFMNKSGITPSIDNLAKLADEYVAATDKSAWAEKAVKVLGKGYQTLIPILAQGGNALREQTAAIADNMIATDDSIKASREYEVAMDNLGDTIQGLKYELANGFIPQLEKLLGTVNELTAKASAEEAVWDDLQAIHKAGLITDMQLVNARLELGAGTKTVQELTNEYADEVDQLNNIEAYNLEIEREEAIRRGGLNDATKDLDLTTLGYAATLGATTTATKNYIEATNEAGMAIFDLEKKTLGMAAIDALNKSFEAGTISENTYKVKMAEMMREMLGMDEKAVATTLSMELLKDQLDAGELSAAQYADAVRRLYDEMNNLDGKIIHTEIQLTYSAYGAGTGQKTGRASGGPVMAGYPYIVGEAGPELFVPNQSGTIKSNQTINNNQQYHLHTNAQNIRERDFNMMKYTAG